MKHQETATPTELVTAAASPPPTEWDVRFGVTALGAFTTHITGTAPGEVKRVFILLAPAMAWLYPGPGETKALRENERLKKELDRERGIYRENGHVWESTHDGNEWCSRCDAISTAFGSVKSECPGKVSTPEKSPVQP